MFPLYRILLMSLRIIGFMMILYGCGRYRFRAVWLIPALAGGIWCFPLYFYLKCRVLKAEGADPLSIGRAAASLEASWLFVGLHFAVQAAIALAIVRARSEVVAEALDPTPWLELKNWAIAAVVACYVLALVRIDHVVHKDR